VRQQKIVADEPIPQIPTLEDESNFIIVPETQDFLRVGLLGLVTGLLIPALAWLLQKFIISPIFCHDTSLAVCSSGDLTTYYISTVVLGVVAVALMANWQVFRPLLIAVAAASALWGLQRYASGTVSHSGWEYYVSSGILYGLAFLLFYWLLRLKSFTLSVVLTVMLVILIRWALLA
jgi:hypothetical protein